VKLGSQSGKELLTKLRKEFPSLVMQLVKIDSLNSKFLEMIAEQTVQARMNRSLLAEKEDIDLILRLAGTTQIAEAIKRVGHQRTGNNTLIAIGKEKDMKPFMRYLSQEKAFMKLSRFALSEEELELIERSALLNVERS
jgi:tRNA threonylcarbamoyladenosine modification (KEOPS) complex Cgi121 subunit